MDRHTFAEFNRQSNREREDKWVEFGKRAVRAETDSKREYWVARATSLAGKKRPQ